MKNKTWIKFLLVTVILLSVIFAFASCTPDEDPIDDTNPDDTNPDDTNKDDTTLSYAIPDDLTVDISVYFLNTEEINKKGVATKVTLNGLTQQIITMTTTKAGIESTTKYVAYAVTDILAKLEVTLPTITSVQAVATDGYVGKYTITSLANTFLTIGYEENGEFVADVKGDAQQGPRFISDKTSNASNSVAKMLSKIVINPISQEYAIPEGLEVSIELFEESDAATDKIATITNSVLLSVRQQVVEMTTIKGGDTTVTNYVAYSLADIFAYLGYESPEEDSIKGSSGDYNKTNDVADYEDAYITIGRIDDGEFDVDSDSPRFIPDINGTSSGSVMKGADKLVINPLA